jgi:hypothetical protein
MVLAKRDDEQKQISLEDFGVSVARIENLPHLPPAEKGRATSRQIRYKDFGTLTFADYELFASLPEHPFWGQVDRLIDFSFADELCAHLYSPKGQRPYAPSLKLKVHLVQVVENLSDRQMEMRMTFDIGIKRFLGVPMSFTGFDHSTIGLDRERMGDLFHACFHYILAQAKQHGLWGDRDDYWLVDAFHTHARAIRMGAHRLVFHGMLNIVQHLKRTNRPLFQLAVDMLKVDEWFERTPAKASPEERMAAFSLLVARAYTLLSWFKNGEGHKNFLQWEDKKQQQRSLELQETLRRILQENTRPTDPTDPSPTTDKTQKESGSQNLQYEKIPRKERPKNRILNAHDPDLRNGHKSNKLPFFGDKIQVVTSNASGLILEIEPIPGNEPDGDRLSSLVESIARHHETKPKYVVADTVYGFGKHRAQLKKMKFQLVAPLKNIQNPTGLLGNEHFQYDAVREQVTCPEGHTTSKRVRNNVEEGYQYKFDSQVCAICPRKQECTNNEKGRTIFVSDYYDIFQEGKAFNETEEGQAVLRARSKIERTNNELANHHEMRRPWTRGRHKLRQIAKLKAMGVNVKIIVKTLGTFREDPFVRRPRRQRGVATCA